jgi:signal peptidase I
LPEHGIGGGGVETVEGQPAVDTAARRWRRALLLACCTAYLGQIYNGQLKKAVLFFCIGVAIMAGGIATLFTSVPAPFNVLTMFVGTVGWWIFVIVQATVYAKRHGAPYRPKWYNKWYAYVVAVMIAIALGSAFTTVIKSRIVRAFRIPTSSMMPSLLPGDCVFADMSATGKRHISRGDVIVFVHPYHAGGLSVKRCVALGGDVVELVRNRLIINGRRVVEEYILLEGPDPQHSTLGPVQLPEGSVFVLGDNRNASEDSRRWGPLDVDLILGRMMTIYWSYDAVERRPRWGRVGSRLERPRLEPTTRDLRADSK